MTREAFCITYTSLMEYYQYIEGHLEGIYALLCPKGFFPGLEDVEQDSIRRIIHKIQVLEREQKVSILSPEEYEALFALCQRRNFWTHSCFWEKAFNKDGVLKKPDDIRQMQQDLRDAEEMRDLLFERKMSIDKG